ncbi:GerAB/ArcD/ProY family transporter [Scopulibacillus cellulosilyticus]|uniref:Endospore germination permease n=1 Tax=Scopulibacillus cellulosilyticus TaxID=2665665 RepID=A0ABW2PVS2_9BACL
MLEKGKISVLQMGMMTYLMIGATAILIVPSITAQKAGRDMWLSPVFSSLSGILAVWIAWKLYKLFPEESIIEASEKILGRTLGKILSFPFLFFLLHTYGTIAREYGEFVTAAYLYKTPIGVVMGFMILVCIFAVRGGIEVIARCTQIFLPMIILFSFVMIILVLPDLNPYNMLPILESGLMPAIKGSISPHIWFIEFFYISFLFPLLNRRKKVLRGGMVPVLTLMLTMVISNLIGLFVLGDLTAKFNFPIYTVGKYISIADFLQHLDAIILAIWIGGNFIQLSVWLYVLVLGTAQWLNLSDYRPIVFPLGFLSTLFSIWVVPNFQDLVLFFSTAVIPWAYITLAVYPLFLLGVGTIQRRAKTKMPSTS